MAPTYSHMAPHRCFCLWVSVVLAAGASVFLGPESPEAVAAAPTPVWGIESRALPTNFHPGGTGEFEVAIANVTGAALDASSITIVDILPVGLDATTLALGGVEGTLSSAQALGGELCRKSGFPADGVVVSCVVPTVLTGRSLGRESMQLHVGVEVPIGSAVGHIEN